MGRSRCGGGVEYGDSSSDSWLPRSDLLGYLDFTMKLARCAICFVLIGPITVTASVGQTATPPIQPTQSEKRSAPTIASASSVHTSDDVDVLRETQLTITMPHHSGLIWWIPFEFWALSAEKNGNSPEKVRDGLKALRDYTIVGVVAAKVSTLGTFDYTTPNDLQSMFSSVTPKARTIPRWRT